MKSKTFINAVVPLLILFSACSRKNPTDPVGKGYVVIKLVQAQEDSLAKTTSIQSLDSVRCIISKDGKDVLDNSLSKEGTVFRAQFELEPGTGYTILLYGMKASAVAYRGSKNGVKVSAGKTISVPISFIPFRVSLIQPSSGRTISDNTPTFQWNSLSGAVRYMLQINTKNDFTTVIDQQNGLTNTNYTPSYSLRDGNYFWRVQGQDNLNNWGSWSSTWVCIIKITGPPAPILTAPVNGAATADNTPTFSWNAATGATGYQLQASANNDFVTLVIDQQNLTATSYAPSTSLNDGIYYWRVQAKDDLGNWGNWSEAWRITIQTSGPLAPILIAPANTTTNNDNTPTFSWTAASGAAGYQLQVSASNGFATLVIDQQNLITSSYTPSTSLNDGTYYWRVRAKDNLGNWGNWSEVWNFTIKITGSSTFKSFGGINEEVGNTILQTSDGSYIIAGYTWSLGAGNGDVWLIKTDANGLEQWNKTFGGSNDDAAYCIQQTLDGGYVITGYTNSFGAGSSDVWLIKVSDRGDEQWRKTFGGWNHDWGVSVRQTSDSGYLIAGFTRSYGAGAADLWLIKTDANGIEQWNKIFGDSGDDAGYSMQQTNDGGFIIAGATESYGAGSYDVWLVKVSTDGAVLWNKTFGGPDVDMGRSVWQSTDGGYVIAGVTGSYGVGNRDVWLIKTDTNGVMQWNRTYGGSALDEGYSVQQTSDGGFIITGQTSSAGLAGDVWLIKTDSNGIEQWNKTFGGTNVDVGYSVQQTKDAGFIITGYTVSPGSGNSDVILIKTDSQGNAVW